jgi:ribosomal-protein-alanine N-acetyltransferase
MVLRSAVPTDAALLAALHSQGFRDAWNEQAFATLLATPGTFGLLAGTDQPLGFILCRAAADEAEILTLFVPEPHRRTGVATALIGRAADLARGAGVTALFLEVADDNESARALYAATGFVEVGRRPRYYQAKIDAVMMKREIGAGREAAVK